MAVKSVRRSKLTKKLLENLESEISILTAIRHDHIVGLIECQVFMLFFLFSLLFYLLFFVQLENRVEYISSDGILFVR